MSIGKLQILDESRAASAFTAWTEYLCFRQLSRRSFELSIRGYQILGELQDYYDKDSDSYNIPSEIDGRQVIRTEDSYVVGGQLVNHSDAIMPIEFSNLDAPGVMDWLSNVDRVDFATISRIKALMQIQ